MAISNTLIKFIQEVRNEGESYRDANFHKNRKEEIEKVFLPSFDAMSIRFEELVTAYNNLKAIPGISGISIEIDLFKESISELKKKIVKDDYDKFYVLNLKKSLDANYDLLAAIWREYITNKTSARSEMIITLDKLIADMPEKATLQTKKTIFTAAKIGAPNAVKAIDEYIETYDNLMNKLDLKGNVLDFLKSLTSGERVSVLDMDEEVYKWLKTSGFANKILLKIN